MKKTLFLSAAIAMAALGASAQGYVNGNNANTSFFVKISNSADGSNPVTIGTPATAAGFVGAGPGQVTIEIFAATQGTTLAALESSTPIAVVQNSVNASIPTVQGTFQGGNPLATSFSGTGEFILYAFVGTAQNQTYTGWSTEAINISVPATGTGAPAPSIFGTAAGLINSLTLVPVPEPTTMALGGIGAAALLLFRRKK